MTVDYRDTIFLPRTDFPHARRPAEKGAEIQKRWEVEDLYGQLRRISEGREKFILHDGPPYANGNIHIGTGLNKILKDLINRTQQMLGKDANYVPAGTATACPSSGRSRSSIAPGAGTRMPFPSTISGASAASSPSTGSTSSARSSSASV